MKEKTIYKAKINNSENYFHVFYLPQTKKYRLIGADVIVNSEFVEVIKEVKRKRNFQDALCQSLSFSVNNKEVLKYEKINYTTIFNMINSLYRENNRVIDPITKKRHTLNYVKWSNGVKVFGIDKDLYEFVLYDLESDTYAEVIELGIDKEAEHIAHTEKFIKMWKSSGFETPQEMLRDMYKNGLHKD